MSGYVASARIARASPRLARSGAAADLASPVSAAPANETVELRSGTIAPDGGPILAARWGAARERWSQLTFFLFDPNSWRT